MAQQRHDSRMSSRATGMWARPTSICLLLGVAALALFWPVTHFGFITLDDPDYVTANSLVQRGLSWEGVAWAFRIGYAHNWHPVTWLTHLLDAELAGTSAAGPHFVNLLLHAANTILLFLVLRSATGAHWRSAIVAALFAFHPLHIESVASISERKDGLSILFWFFALWAYGKSADNSQGLEVHPASWRSGWYWLALTFF